MNYLMVAKFKKTKMFYLTFNSEVEVKNNEKSEVKQSLLKLNGAKEKEDFLKVHNIKFTHDSFQRLIIWCSDGILTLYPTF